MSTPEAAHLPREQECYRDSESSRSVLKIRLEEMIGP
jgi:hypothetical protein